jgi:transcription antitermination factor NusG
MENYVWVICYVDITKIDSIEKNLGKKYRKYLNVEAFVPLVKILNKTFKRKDLYKEVPLLLNYGFFKVPEYFIYNDETLRLLKEDVEAIYQWVKDPAKESRRKRKKRKMPTVALATQTEIEQLIVQSKKFSTYTPEQVDELQVGSIVTLRTYPFENMMVEILEIHKARKKVDVKIISDVKIHSKVTISFDHLFYTIYHENSLVNSGKEVTIGDIKDRGFDLENHYHHEPDY